MKRSKDDGGGVGQREMREREREKGREKGGIKGEEGRKAKRKKA